MDEEQKSSESGPTFAGPTGVKLSPEEIIDAIDHINKKAILENDACIVCGNPNNNVVEDVYQVSVVNQTASFGGAYQPLISTVCNNCGFVRFFNRLIVSALISAEKQKAESRPDQEESTENGR